MLSVTLRRLIDQKLTTAREIGELTGTAPSTVYRWIRGEAQPSFDTIRLLMRHLRNREAQAALLAAFTVSTPWRFSADDVDIEIPRESGADIHVDLESALRTLQATIRSMSTIHDAAGDRSLSDNETEQLMRDTQAVIRASTLLQKNIQSLSEARRGTPSPQTPQARR